MSHQPQSPVRRTAGPVGPGRLVRTVGRVVPGVRRSGEQIADFGAEWHRRNDAAILRSSPLWIALGDSLAQGIGASSVDAGYVARLAEEHTGLDVVNFSKSGAKIADVIVDQLSLVALLPRPPAFLTCSVGSNDLLRSVNIRASTRAMRLLIDMLPDNAVMATVPDRGSLAAKTLNKTIRSACDQRQLPVADVARALDSWKGRLAADGMHPNDHGHQLWVEAFLPLTTRLLPTTATTQDLAAPS